MSTFTPLEQTKIVDVKFKIQQKINDSFDDIRTYIPIDFKGDDYIVSGGCIASLLQGEKPKDWDIYGLNLEASQVIEIHALKNIQFRENMVKEIDDRYRDVETSVSGYLVTENATTLGNHLQFIHKTYGNPEEIRSTFDFVHCTPYYSVKENRLYISRRQFDAIINKQLIVNNPVAVTKEREMKFFSRGYQWQ